MRVRFAPSPTGPLHIGGVRTALYNYLLAKKLKGTFILRIEDTDQKRYVPGAEKYILDSLEWLGLKPDEGPQQGGDFGPYRQSERKEIYQSEIKTLVENGTAYRAFDTPEALEEMRQAQNEKGIHSPKYDHSVRMSMRNSLTMSRAEVDQALEDQIAHVIRLKVIPAQLVKVTDAIRGEVTFDSSELDDKVLMKSDGMPTYHLANIIDDHMMEISHVIRGEEWLSSTAHHVLLYQAFGWEDSMPIFAHLPLILKPTGKGKLSKRDGSKLGIPVFPLSWKGGAEDDHFDGFKSFGFLPDAVINFLALLGWNSGTEQEIFSMDQLIEQFEIENIGKSGARFDYEKAKWFNQSYISSLMDSQLARLIKPILEKSNINASEDQLFDVADMMKDRLETLNDILPKSRFFFEAPNSFDLKQVKKRWKEGSAANLEHYKDFTNELKFGQSESIETDSKAWINEQSIGFGAILPQLRLALCGSLQGPDLFRIINFLGQKETANRINNALETFPKLLQDATN